MQTRTFRGGLWLLLAGIAASGGCGWMGSHFVDRSSEYLHAESTAPLRLPGALNKAAVEEVLVIPDIPQQPQAELFPDAAPRPTALYGPEEEAIKIQMLGGVRWLVIPQPPALVWPQLKQFFVDNAVPIGFEAPADGRIDTGWMQVDPGLSRDVVRLSLLEAKAEVGLSGGHDRLRVQLEQGLRASSSEIIIRHEHDPGDGSVAAVAADGDLRGQPGRTEVDLVLLNAVGGYIAANVGEPAFSLQAAALASRGKAVVTHDAAGVPVLRLDLDFDRAWATLRQALTDADVDIQDIDRSEGMFYLALRESDLTGEEERKFLRRWRRQEPAQDMKMKMQQTDQGYEVALYHQDDRPIDRDKSYTFLIKLLEFAT
jgi:outer membrane protein assembly factor BamC